MDISSIYGLGDIASYSSNLKTQAKAESFQTELENAIAAKDDQELKKACVEFESYFLKMMLSEMRKTVVSNQGVFEKSHAEEIFQDLLDEKLCSEIANGSNNVGLADMMYKQLSKTAQSVDFQA